MKTEATTVTSLQWQEADNAENLAEMLSSHIANCLQQAIDQQGEAALVVSGGSTPTPVFRRLSVCDIAWANVTVTLADERWVAPDHADSNEALVRNTLLVERAATAEFVPLYRENCTLKEGLPQVSAEVAAIRRPFTVVVFGMGNDGHTASLFPDAPADQLRAAMDLANPHFVAHLQPPSVPQQRITLTRRALLDCQHRILHITGAQKRQVLVSAFDAASKISTDGNETDTATHREHSLYRPGLAPILSVLGAADYAGKPLDTPWVYWSP